MKTKRFLCIDKIYDALCFALLSLYSIQDLDNWTDLGLSEGVE